MYFRNIIESLALAAVAMAAIAVVPANGDSLVVEHGYISPRSEETQLPPFSLAEGHLLADNEEAVDYAQVDDYLSKSEVLNRVKARLNGLRYDLDDIYSDFAYSLLPGAEDHGSTDPHDLDDMHMLIDAATGKALLDLHAAIKCVRSNVHVDEDGYFEDDGIALRCVRETMRWYGQPGRAVQDAVNIVRTQELKIQPMKKELARRQNTVTAAPIGTTTVYTTVPAATVLAPGFLSHLTELLATNIGGTYGVLTTTVLDSTAVTVTTWPGVPAANVTTLTDPINPTVTTVRTLGVSQSISNNTSIDTRSFIDISTFSADGLPTQTPSSSLSLDSSIVSQLSSQMSGSISSALASTTIAVGGHPTMTQGSGGKLPSETSTVSSKTAKTIDSSGTNTILAMLAGMGACFAFALLL